MRVPNIVVVLFILLVMVWGQDVFAAQKVEVLLKGQAQPISGYLREVSQTSYILQGPDQFFEFGAEELISVNGKKAPSKKDLGQGRLVYVTHYEKILPSGDVETWFTLDINNTGTKLINSLDWGAAEWELEETRNQKVRDQFGNELATTVTPRESGIYKVEVLLPVPVVPMEHVSLNVMRLRKAAAKPTDSGNWRYTFNCDFPEDRFFVRKVEFPAGTEVMVPQGWRLNELDGRILLHSHFYYPANLVVPQVIEYRLP
jgi:hypothetical protein